MAFDGIEDDDNINTVKVMQKPIPIDVNKIKRPEIVTEIKAIGDDVFRIMESEDEKQIIKAELFEESIKSLVYITPRKEMALTITGIFEAARRFKNIETKITRIEKTSDSYIAYAMAKNLKDNISVEIAVEQPIRAPIGPQGTLIKDDFCMQKAQAKALRNAIRKVIPVNYFQAMIKIFVIHGIEERNKQQVKK